MDNLIQKFYSNGKQEEQKYTQFGAFSSKLRKNPFSNLNLDTSQLIKPNIGTINPAIHNSETITQMNKTPNISQDSFLQPKKLVFNSARDLLGQSIMTQNYFENNIKDTNMHTINVTPNKLPSLHTIKQNLNMESKKNATKIQMMEEKMKNLELKNQRLEVINDFFFDMFENNLVKEELKRQKEINEKNNKSDNNNKNINDNDNDEDDTEEKRPKKRIKKLKKRNLFKTDLGAQKRKELDMDINNFKEKTKGFARYYLNTVKNNIGISLIDEQIRKREELQDMTENIIELKGDLLNKLENIQNNQELQMKKIAYCLQNSGDEQVERLANRVFGDTILKKIDMANYDSVYKARNKERGSIFIPRDSIFNLRKQSITSMNDDNNNNQSKRGSFIDNEKRQSINKSKRQSFINKSKRSSFIDNKVQRKSLFKKENDIIPEDVHEIEG